MTANQIISGDKWQGGEDGDFGHVLSQLNPSVME
jgi:hypothetical protein